LAESYALFNPQQFSCSKLQILASTIEEIFYKGDHQYKKTEKTEFENFDSRPKKFYANDVEISEREYKFALTDDVHLMERSHLIFLEGSKVCDFYFYHMYDYNVIAVVEVEFFSLAERENFIRPYWFGKEVEAKRFDAKAIYEQLTQIV
jgi:hypothetical protein